MTSFSTIILGTGHKETYRAGEAPQGSTFGGLRILFNVFPVRSVYSMSGTTSEAGTLSSSVSGLGSSRYSSTTGSSSIRRGPAGDMRDVARDRQMARRRLNIRSKSTGREMDPRFQDIANVYSHPAGKKIRYSESLMEI